MKFVFNRKSGRMEPEDWQEKSLSPLEETVFAYLKEHPTLPKEKNYSTRSIGMQILNDLEFSYSELDAVRTAIAKWNNAHEFSSSEGLMEEISEFASRAIIDEVERKAAELKKAVASEEVDGDEISLESTDHEISSLLGTEELDTSMEDGISKALSLADRLLVAVEPFGFYDVFVEDDPTRQAEGEEFFIVLVAPRISVQQMSEADKVVSAFSEVSAVSKICNTHSPIDGLEACLLEVSLKTPTFSVRESVSDTMTYDEWVEKYREYEEPEDGWSMTDRDYVLAEMYSDARQCLREDYPEYWERYIDLSSMNVAEESVDTNAEYILAYSPQMKTYAIVNVKIQPKTWDGWDELVGVGTQLYDKVFTSIERARTRAKSDSEIKNFAEKIIDIPVKAEEAASWDRGEGQLPKDWKSLSDEELEELVSYFSQLLRWLPFSSSKWKTWAGRRDQIKRELEKREAISVKPVLKDERESEDKQPKEAAACESTIDWKPGMRVWWSLGSSQSTGTIRVAGRQFCFIDEDRGNGLTKRTRVPNHYLNVLVDSEVLQDERESKDKQPKEAVANEKPKLKFKKR